MRMTAVLELHGGLDGARTRCVVLEERERVLSLHLLSGLRHHCWHPLDDEDVRRKVTTGGEVKEHSGIRTLYTWEADEECCICHRLVNYYHDVKDRVTDLDRFLSLELKGSGLSLAWLKAHENSDAKHLERLKSAGVPIQEPTRQSTPKSR